jgi:hypothetical protein
MRSSNSCTPWASGVAVGFDHDGAVGLLDDLLLLPGPVEQVDVGSRPLRVLQQVVEHRTAGPDVQQPVVLDHQDDVLVVRHGAPLHPSCPCRGERGTRARQPEE